jgi:hypothetical protein
MQKFHVSIYPFGVYHEQVWIGQMVDGEFSKMQQAFKDTEIAIKKKSSGAFGKPSTRQDLVIHVPDGYENAIATRRYTGQHTVKIDTEWEIIYSPSV